MSKIISIVVPTHNESSNINELNNRIIQVFNNLPNYDYELIFIDDSRDNTPFVIAELIKHDSKVNLIRLSRSFGQAIAICAGLEHCTGHGAIMMDADLQDPPEVIPKLIAKWEQGNQVVYVRRPSSQQSLIYSYCSKIFYRLLRFLASVEIPMQAGEFRLIDRSVIDVLNKFQEKTRFMRGITMWPGFSVDSIEIRREDRIHGETNYNFLRSMLVAIDGFVSFSVAPLRMAILLGVVMFLLSMLGIIYAIGLRLATDTWVSGWTLMFVVMLTIGGLQFIVLGVIGEYIGRIFLEVLNRPLYVVDYLIGANLKKITNDQKN